MTSDALSRKSVNLLAIYAVVGAMLALWRFATGTGTILTVGTYVAVIGAVTITRHANDRRAVMVRDWMPLLSLPALYAAIPRTALVIGPFDGAVQGVDRALFGGDVAHSFAGTAPSRPFSELLHVAYLSYYLIIYAPPLLMYVVGDLAPFRRMVFAFTIAMVGCLALFCVFPVEGPRYVWLAPPGVPNGFFRWLAVTILERGSSRGTAFPSSHQAIACVMALSSVQWSRVAGGVVVALTALLGIGAVYGGFHYGTDMLAGLAVGVSSWWVAGQISKTESGKAASA